MNTTENSLHPALPDNFSLVLGGPTFQLWRRLNLTGGGLQLLRRRVCVLALLAWLPLLVLSLAEGHALSGTVTVPFLGDLETHLRLLVAIPLLLIAERVVHERLRIVVRQFLSRGLIPTDARIQFDAALASAMRLRDSFAAEVLLFGLVYGVGVLLLWRTQVALDVSSWYGRADSNGILQPSLAGWWMGCVSIPLFQFLLIRWYFRMLIWTRFLWQVSRIDLRLSATNPDRCSGLGFLSNVSSAFAPVLLAQGMVFAGLIADRIFYAGAKLPEFKLELFGLVAIALLTVLGPLLVFAPRLAAAKQKGVRKFGDLAESYSTEFDRKWLGGTTATAEPLLGNADIQSLADLGNSFELVKRARSVPFTMETVGRLAAITLAPVAPLLLTMMPVEELLTRLVKILF